jgi:hypothetical protein
VSPVDIVNANYSPSSRWYWIMTQERKSHAIRICHKRRLKERPCGLVVQMAGSRSQQKAGPPSIDYGQRHRVQTEILCSEDDRWTENGNQLKDTTTNFVTIAQLADHYRQRERSMATSGRVTLQVTHMKGVLGLSLLCLRSHGK